ncbi:flavin reductase family protein [Raineya orbicola]|jgi:flavin reductase (DIM6/NTAB) family NADH-FMN oxidoreductase RutF|uniref:Flavin reductase like domain n=1 Tax=Raineya orbicola TaxID=2016530 RepID=A0A2N3IK14_9BACT|nr:flavin reductase family protein [Raineya orbicola]PKQ70654.1 Flavin reductase like domain [Raineya orbicola]
MSIKTISPQEVSIADFHSILLSAVAPRPIAFASTLDSEGNINLSPFSFFNAFGANPPILIFSPARRVRDNTTKHTLENVRQVPEVVINVVNYAMVEQTSLASTEYDKGVNEFIKAGFTQVPSVLIKPPRVGESPVAFECKVLQIIETGTQGGAGNLVICEVLLAHVKEEILDSKGKIDTRKIDLVGRMGGEWYCRANGEALFEIPKPLTTKGIGIDQLPETIRNSSILTGNNLGRLANVEKLPSTEEIQSFQDDRLQTIQQNFSGTELIKQTHLYAQELLQAGKIQEAWRVLLK